MHPKVEITIDGQPVSGAFYERLESLVVTDKEGLKSDTVEIRLSDGPPDFLAIPRTGAIIGVRMGYGETLRPLGTFTADKVNLDCLPYRMSISGKATDLRSGKLKERQERAWDDVTLGDVLSDIARESGLTPSIDEELAQYRYEWLGQQDETNLHFLRRLAERHNGLFSIKQGRLLFSRLGSGQASSGTPLGSVIVVPSMVLTGTLKVEISDRTKYSKVVAYYQDRDKAERVEIEADADADGDSVYRIPEAFSSPDEADRAAQAKAKDLQRGKGSVSVTVIGDTSICASAPLLFADIRPGLDGVPYVIETVAHRFDKASAYTAAITGKLYDGKSASEGKGGTGEDGDDGGKVAPNAAPGAPGTPSAFLQPRRYARTDEN